MVYALSKFERELEAEQGWEETERLVSDALLLPHVQFVKCLAYALSYTQPKFLLSPTERSQVRQGGKDMPERLQRIVIRAYDEAGGWLSDPEQQAVLVAHGFGPAIIQSEPRNVVIRDPPWVWEPDMLTENADWWVGVVKRAVRDAVLLRALTRC
ncbi:MAG TPA: hypothetical protein VMX97_13485 [Hyphomicrobiaceae bacterium]|nr:hypothetical protein [Hyphomicrobiaceae bacterium]